MTRPEAVKMIYSRLSYGGLPRAIKIYNYLSLDGEIEITAAQIIDYFKK